MGKAVQFIVTHTCAGFDALAALVAATKIFPGATGFLPEPLPGKVRSFVNMFRDSLPPEEDFPADIQPGLAVLVDTREIDRLGAYAAPVRRSRAVYIFDRLRPGAAVEPVGVRCTIEPVGATTTILVEQIRLHGLPLTGLEATLMALGIYESTGCLVNSGTTSRDVEAVLFLWRQGLEQAILQEHLCLPAVTGSAPEPLPGSESDPDPERHANLNAPLAMPAPAHGENLLPLFKERLPGKFRSLLLLIGQRADRLGAEVYLVGGVIRDLLLGRRPGRDLDCVVLPEAALLARDLQQYLGGALRVNEQFGTATLYLKDGLRLDLVTARRDFYAAVAALPRVEASSLKNDLFRRDFTINTMACSLMTSTFGRFFDFYSGRCDLERGCLRTLYQLSFIDDPLRILRAVRFAVRFGFTIEEETHKLMLKAVRGRVLEKIGRQRLNNEISLIYDEESPPKILHRLSELGVLSYLYPRLEIGPETWIRLQKVQQALQWAHGQKWPRFFRAETVYTAALLYELAQGERALLLRRLQQSKEYSSGITGACNGVPVALAQMKGRELSPSAVVFLLEPLPAEGLILLYALGGSGLARRQLLHYLDLLQHRRPHLTGKDLVAAGLQPGPAYRKILNMLRAAVLDGTVRTPAEEYALLETLLEQHLSPARAENPQKEVEGGFESLPDGPAHSGTVDRHHRA